jgi:hypothetical protein
VRYEASALSSRISMPSMVHSHENEKENATSSAIPVITPPAPPCGRKPVMSPSARITVEAIV